MTLSLRDVGREAKLLLIGIPVFLWTILPIYHLFLFAISPKESVFSGRFWPEHPTLRNFGVVFGQQHYYLSHFWRQLWNSLLIAVSTGVLTLMIATAAAFAISRLKVRGGRTVMNLALFTYFIPAAFLAVPMYRTMGIYGLLNTQPALILAMVTVASPYAIWVLKQASDKLPYELDEAAVMDGATKWHQFRYVTWPSMQTLYLTCTILSMIWTLGDFNSVYLLTGGGPADLTHVLATLGIRYLGLDELNLAMASIVCAMPLVLPLVYFMMKRLSR